MVISSRSENWYKSCWCSHLKITFKIGSRPNKSWANSNSSWYWIYVPKNQLEQEKFLEGGLLCKPPSFLQVFCFKPLVSYRFTPWFIIFICYTEFCRKYGACRQAVKTSDCGSDMHGFESHQAPHLKKHSQECFFMRWWGWEPIWGFERGASRVRRSFAKRIKFFEAKTVDTFNANRSRQPRLPLHLKKDR